MRFINNTYKLYLAFFLILIISVITFLPFFQKGFFSIHDDTQVARVYEMGKELKRGVFPVRWVEDLGYGYGYPIFNFYSPFPYYIGGILNILGFNALISTKLVFILAIILSGMSMFILVKDLFGTLSGIVSSVVYLYFPYHALNIYVRGDLDELWAYSFIPLVFFGMMKIFKTHNVRWSLITSIFLFLVIISHNLTSFMLLFFLLIFVAISVFYTKKKKKYLVLVSAACIGGLLASSFYSLPAVFESSSTNLSSQIGGGANFKDHFVCLSQFWESTWGFGGSAPGCIDGMSFRLGKLNIALVILSLVISLIKFNETRKNMFVVFSIFSLFISIFMMSSVSEIIWRTIPFASFLQYPWRFLNFTSLFVSVIVGFIFVEAFWFIKSRFLIFALTVLVIGLTIYNNSKLFTPQFLYLKDVNYYTNNSYLLWNVSKISDEYLPKNFIKPNSEHQIPKNPIEIVSGEAQLKIKQEDKIGVSGVINLEDNATIRINRTPSHSWDLKVNDRNTTFKIKNDGLYVDLTNGSYNISLKIRQTLLENISNLISLVTILTIIIGIIRWPFLRRIS